MSQPSSSESRLAAMGREAPLDSAAAAAAAIATALVLGAGDQGTGLTPEQAAAVCTGAFSLAAALRAWFRSRRRVRESRRAARKVRRENP